MPITGSTATALKLDYTPLTTTYGGENTVGNKMRLFAKWVEKKEVRKTPVTEWMTRRSDPFDNPVIEIGQSYAPFITTTLTSPTTNSSNVLTVANSTYFREGDVVKITPYWTGSTTELKYSAAEYATLKAQAASGTDPAWTATTMTAWRNVGTGLGTGQWSVHPATSEVRVVSRAVNYNDPFSDAVTFRGTAIEQYVQRFESGEIVYDIAATKTPDYEADNHMLKDIANLKEQMLKYRESAFIEGRKVAPDYDGVVGSNTQIPGQMMGMIQFAELGSQNVSAIDGQINPFSFDDILRNKAELHSDGPGDTMFGGYKTIAALDTALNEMKGNFGPNETTFTSKTTKLSYRWGDITPKPIHGWPEGVILITSKSDWEWGNYAGMDWQYVERGPEELGAFQKGWVMGGDFSLVCKDIQRQVLLTGIDTRLDLYPGRQIFMTGQ